MPYVVGGGSESGSDAFQSSHTELDSSLVYFDPHGLVTAHSVDELALGYAGDAFVDYSAYRQGSEYEENASSWRWWGVTREDYTWFDGTQAVPSPVLRPRHQHFVYDQFSGYDFSTSSMTYAPQEFAEGDHVHLSTQENETEQGKENNVAKVSLHATLAKFSRSFAAS